MGTKNHQQSFDNKTNNKHRASRSQIPNNGLSDGNSTFEKINSIQNLNKGSSMDYDGMSQNAS